MSFRKAKDSKVTKGTRISTLNLQILTSTGIASLDEIIGGGMPMSKVLMIKQDRYTGYANLILKYWVAQGIAHEQSVMFISLDAQPEEYMVDLMGIVSGKQESTQEEEEDEVVPQTSGRTLGALRSTKMEIAWRYQRLPQLSTLKSSEFKGPNNTIYCHTFDLTKRIDTNILNTSSLYLVGKEFFNSAPKLASDFSLAHKFDLLVAEIEKVIAGHAKDNENPSIPKKMLRIAIHNLASPLWGEIKGSELTKFINKIQALVREKLVSIVFTIPAYLYNDYYKKSSSKLIRMAEHAVDGVIEVESFAGTPNPVDEKYISDYHGLIHPLKLFPYENVTNTTRLNSVELHSLGFKVRRKRFLVETFVLPPEDEDEQNESSLVGSKAKSTPGCAPRSNKDPLDF